MNRLTFAAAVALVKDIVNRAPEGYKYTTDPKTTKTRARGVRGQYKACYYRHFDGTPGCIIGHLVDKLNPGVEIRESISVTEALETAGYEIDGITMTFLSTVQQTQDNGSTWQHAFEHGYAYAMATTGW